jgi:hypothetical protein
MVKALLTLCLTARIVAAATLVWDDPDPAVVSYNVYQVSGTNQQVFRATDKMLALTNLVLSQTYMFTVTALSQAGVESEESDSVSYTPVVVTAPASPVITNSVWTKVTNYWHVSLGWDVVTNASLYVVTYSTTNFLASIGTTNRTFLHNSLAYGPWKISVQSSNSMGLSPVDSFVLSPTIPAKPSNVRIQ